MNENIVYELLARYMAGECSDSEKSEVDRWINASPENGKLFRDIRQIYSKSAIPLGKPDIEMALKTVMENAVPSGGKPAGSGRARPIVRRFSTASVMRYAALFILVVMTPVLYFMLDGNVFNNDNAGDIVTLAVDRNSIERITLEDGTHVTIDSGSQLTYPSKFGSRSREIELSGEAYFTVAEDSQRPFIIRTGNGIIEVLGTKFNVRSWEKDGTVEVAVTEGRVSLRREVWNAEKAVIISTNHAAVLESTGRISEAYAVNTRNYLTWMDREMSFHDVLLQEIVDQVSRWYNLEILFDDSGLLELNVSIHVRNRPIDDILELIATLTNTVFEREGNNVRFTDK